MHPLLVTGVRRDELLEQSSTWPSWTVTGDVLTQLEMLIAGFLWPLRGFAPSGEPGAMPLEVSADLASRVAPGADVALRDPEGVLLAALRVQDRWEINGVWCLAGPVDGIELPAHDDFTGLRLTPGEAPLARGDDGGYAPVAG